MTDDRLRCPTSPCGTCPYRRDVPAGIWHPEEYAKLPTYDGPTWAQNVKLFQCHQQTGELCAGWVACHDPHELLALRFFQERLHPSVFDYKSPVPVFGSGMEAARHGLSGVGQPDERANRAIDGLVRKRSRRRRSCSSRETGHPKN